MSTLEQTVTKGSIRSAARRSSRESLPTRALKVLCSVRFGVIPLVLLGGACLVGMLVMQQKADGLDRYFQQIIPARGLVYGWLGLFNVYHAWYFNALLAALLINIIFVVARPFSQNLEIRITPSRELTISTILSSAETRISVINFGDKFLRFYEGLVTSRNTVGG